ncbi:MAG: hypothetical protein ACYSUD_19480 [Planctomycetota bacterium]|jgi:hypothetical protein
MSEKSVLKAKHLHKLWVVLIVVFLLVLMSLKCDMDMATPAY